MTFQGRDQRIAFLERSGPDACPGPFRQRSNDRLVSMLAESGAVALEAIIVASAVVPALILVGVCWIFTERRSAKMDVRGQLRTSSRSSAKGLQDR